MEKKIVLLDTYIITKAVLLDLKQIGINIEKDEDIKMLDEWIKYIFELGYDYGIRDLENNLKK